jgi:hypothetical protein
VSRTYRRSEAAMSSTRRTSDEAELFGVVGACAISALNS